MADLIERDVLVSLWKPLADMDCFAGNVIASCLNELNAQPPVDAVPVVRCRECFFSRKVDDKEPMYKCVNICRDGCTQWLDSNDFCSYGERRSE